MITFKQGDIFTEDVQAIINPVNCVGVMGAGLALQFKNKFPANYQAYRKACQRGDLKPGTLFVHDQGQQSIPRYIINFPTKKHWKDASKLRDIEAGLQALFQETRARNIQSMSIPAIGAGLGGLDWKDVKPRIQNSLDSLTEVAITILEPERQRAR